MADNYTFKDASGSTQTAASDDVAGAHYQKVKLYNSAADSAGILTKAEDDAHVSGDHGIVSLAVRKDTAAALAGTDGDYIPLIVDSLGRTHIAPAPSNSGVDIGDVDILSVIPGTGATHLGKAEDAVHSTGDAGVQLLAVRKDTPAALAGTDGDYIPLIVDANGRLYANEAGDVAHDSADSGNPVKVGGQARTTNPTAVTDADRVNLVLDKIGRMVPANTHVRALVTSSTTTLTTTTETTILAAGGAGVFHDITALTFANTSATAVRVDIRDVTAGSIILSFYLPASDTRGAVFQTPQPQTTANSAWTAQLSGAVTDVKIFIQAIKNV